MLKLIFQNDDLMNEYPMNEYPMNEYPMNEYPMNDEYFYNDYRSHYLYHNQNQHREKVIKSDHYNSDVKNDTDEDWGFYVEIDPSTPPKTLYSKQKNNQSHLAIKIPTHVPQYNETIQQKNVNYLPQIKEEDVPNDQFILDIPGDHKIHNEDYKEKMSQNIFSGLTICALTTVSIYFYSKIRWS